MLWSLSFSWVFDKLNMFFIMYPVQQLDLLKNSYSKFNFSGA